jgi:hypothetical protein
MPTCMRNNYNNTVGLVWASYVQFVTWICVGRWPGTEREKQQSQHPDGFGVGENLHWHIRGETVWMRAVGEVTRCSCMEFNEQPG